MKSAAKRCLLTLSILACAALPVRAEEVRDSVVKIFSSSSPPNMFRPWEIQQPGESTGSGVIIEGGRILTNAHVVAYAQQIYVQPYESSDKLGATIEYISQECDLATLTLDDPESIKDRKPIALADSLPKIQTKVNVLGYPTGGDTLSVTEGVVSRIEFSGYYFSTALLRIQVDAAVNPGNSGGPGIVDDKITGIVFSRLPEGDNIGYLIPAEVIRHFLDDVTADKKFDGFPFLDIRAATTGNPAIRSYLKLDSKTTGMVVHRAYGSPAAETFKPWDVITTCDGVAIDNLGMVPIADGVRVNWMWLLARKQAGSSVKLGIWRDGKAIDVELATAVKHDRVIQRMKGERPTYFIYGGLVFSPVTTEFAEAMGSRWAAFLGYYGRLMIRNMRTYRTNPDDELVATCTNILPHKLNKDYDVSSLSIVTHVNDQPVRNLRHLITLIKQNKEPYIVFRFEDDEQERIVFDPKQVEKEQPQILRNNNIPAACSEDMRDLWP